MGERRLRDRALCSPPRMAAGSSLVRSTSSALHAHAARSNSPAGSPSDGSGADPRPLAMQSRGSADLSGAASATSSRLPAMQSLGGVDLSIDGSAATSCSTSASPASPVRSSSSSSPAASPPAAPPAAPRRMVTHAQTGVLRPNPRYHDTNLVATTSDAVSPVPSSVRAAVRDPHWLAAMRDEFEALVRNRTWELVPPALI